MDRTSREHGSRDKRSVFTHIGFLEQGRREPSLSTLLILAKTLEVPVETLVDDLPVPKKRQPARRGRWVTQ